MTVWRHPAFPFLLLATSLGIIFHESFREIGKAGTFSGFAIDDAWIHAAIAKNLITGQGFGINEGQWIPLSTAPAWTLTLAFFMTFLRDPVLSGWTAACLCQFAAILLMYRLMLRWTQNIFWSLVPALLVTLNPILLWGFPSGMEHPIVILSIVALLYGFDCTKADSRGRRIGVPLLLIFCVLSRPECFVLVPFAFLATAYQNVRSGLAPKPILQVFAIQCVVFLLAIAPYFAFNFATTGHPFPTAFFVKTALRDIGFTASLMTGEWARAWHQVTHSSLYEASLVIQKFSHMNPLLFLLVPVGLISFLPPFRKENPGRSALLLTVALFLPLILGVVAPSNSFSNYANRYLTPFVPIYTLLGGLGLWVLWQFCQQRLTAILCLLMVGYFSLHTFDATTQMFGRDVCNTNEMYVLSGKWLQKNLPQDEVLAINDIGGMAYHCDQEIVDIMGLACIEIWPVLVGKATHGKLKKSRAEGITEFLRERGIRYLIISPQYYPSIDQNRELFEPIQQWDAPFPTRRSIDPQILYRIHWEREA